MPGVGCCGLGWPLQLSRVLFIDSSHVVRVRLGAQLRSGGIPYPGSSSVHAPAEIPAWLAPTLFWTEQYLLQAFLTHNSEFEVLFANAYMGLRYREQMRAVFPNSDWWGGGSFWMRRRTKEETP